MRIAICDDEEIFVSKFEMYLEKYIDKINTIIDIYKSGEEFLKVYKKNKLHYDLIFLDIEMKKINGIETAKKIREFNRDVIIVFLTSHIECALDGYEVNAYRFLTKPIQEEKLVDTLISVNKELANNQKILIKNREEEILLNIKDITYIEAQNNNILINTLDKKFLIRKSLNQIIKEINSPIFFKTHRSYLVNLSYVRTYDNKTIVLEDGSEIILSRSKAKSFKEEMINYIRENAR